MASIFFIQFTLKKQIGERFYHKRIFIIFSLQSFLSIMSEKFEKVPVLEKRANIFLKHLFGSVGFFNELVNRNDKVCLTLDCSNTKTDQVDFVQKQTILFFNLVILIPQTTNRFIMSLLAKGYKTTFLTIIFILKLVRLRVRRIKRKLLMLGKNSDN